MKFSNEISNISFNTRTLVTLILSLQRRTVFAFQCNCLSEIEISRLERKLEAIFSSAFNSCTEWFLKQNFALSASYIPPNKNFGYRVVAGIFLQSLTSHRRYLTRYYGKLNLWTILKYEVCKNLTEIPNSPAHRSLVARTIIILQASRAFSGMIPGLINLLIWSTNKAAMLPEDNVLPYKRATLNLKTDKPQSKVKGKRRKLAPIGSKVAYMDELKQPTAFVGDCLSSPHIDPSFSDSSMKTSQSFGSEGAYRLFGDSPEFSRTDLDKCPFQRLESLSKMPNGDSQNMCPLLKTVPNADHLSKYQDMNQSFLGRQGSWFPDFGFSPSLFSNNGSSNSCHSDNGSLDSFDSDYGSSDSSDYGSSDSCHSDYGSLNSLGSWHSNFGSSRLVLGSSPSDFGSKGLLPFGIGL